MTDSRFYGFITSMASKIQCTFRGQKTDVQSALSELEDTSWKHHTTIVGDSEIDLPSDFRELCVICTGNLSAHKRVYTFTFIRDELDETLDTEHYYSLGFTPMYSYQGGFFAYVFCSKHKFKLGAFVEKDTMISSSTTVNVYYR